MKKTIRYLFLSLLSFSFISCAWEIPKTIAVKTNATYNFGIGKVSKDFTEFFSSDTILDASFAMGESSKMYDYYPGKTNSQIQKYLMKLPLQDIAVNFTEYFNATNIADSITDLSFSETIDVPELKLTMTETVPATALNAAINTMVTATGIGSDVTFTGDFGTVEYTSGTMQVHITSTIASGMVSLMYGGSVICSSTIGSGSAEISLSNVTLHKTGMTIVLPAGSGTYTIAVTPESQVKKITSFTTATPISIPVNAEIANGNSSDDFTECVIGQGQMNTDIVIPSSWTNVTTAYDVNLTGGISASAGKTTGNTKAVLLDNIPVSNAQTNFSSTIELSFAASTVVLSDSVQVKAQTDVSSYAVIGIVLDDLDPQLDKRENISSEMKAMVERLIMTPSGLKGSFKNTFPEGNDITITATSDFVGLTQTSQTLKSNTTENAPISLLSTGEHTVKFRDSPQAADEFDRMDFKVDILLPGATAANPKKLVITDVVPDEQYEITINLEPDINWKEIVLYSDGVEQSDCRSTGLNVSQMFTAFTASMGGDFEGKVSNKTLPIYIYAVKPQMESFDKAKFTGELEMFFGTESSGTLVEKREYGTLTFMEDGSMDFTDMPKLTIEDKTVVSNLDDYPPSEKEDLAKITNNAAADTDGSVYVRFRLKFTNSTYSTDTFTVTWEDYKKSGSTNSSIAIMAFVEVPLEFGLSENVTMDLLNIAGQTGGSDLLGRAGPPEESEKLEFLSAIRDIKINYTSTTLPFYGVPSASLMLDLDGPDSILFEEQTLNLEGGSFTLYDYDEIMSIYPLVPVAQIILHKGSFSIPRKVGLETQISLAIEMDPNYEMVVYGGAE